MKQPWWALAALVITPSLALAQPAPALPDASPRARIEQKVGLTQMWVDYGSPGQKGRTVWGELVPYGELWRTGANKNTVIHLRRRPGAGRRLRAAHHSG